MLRLFLLLIITSSYIFCGAQTKNYKKPSTTTVKNAPKKDIAKATTKNPNSAVTKKPLNNKNSSKDKLSLKKDTIAKQKSVSQLPVKKEPETLKMAVREMEMLTEVNFIRTKPNEYKKFILEYLQTKNPDIATRKAATELIKQMEDMNPLAPVQFSDYLYKQAQIHGQWMEDAGAFEHSEFNNAENLIGGMQNVRDAIINLLIDVSDPKRGHRQNILHPGYKYVGICEVKGSVGGVKNVFVQEFNFKQ